MKWTSWGVISQCWSCSIIFPVCPGKLPAVSISSSVSPTGGDTGGVNLWPSPISSSHVNADLREQLRGGSVSMASSDIDASCVGSVGGGVNPLLPIGAAHSSVDYL